MNVNLVVIGGRIGAEPEFRVTPSGRPVCNFRVATNERFKKANGDKIERTTWHSLVAWGSQAEAIAKYFHTGDPIMIEGRFQQTSWKDGEQTRYRQEVVVEKLHFVSGGRKATAEMSTSDDAPQLPFEDASASDDEPAV